MASFIPAKQKEEEILARIAARKAELADRLLILSHHYQQEAVHQFADLTGDSLRLAREAATIKDRQFLVFCGVHFMAEAADILADEAQQVILPHQSAGCPMADMSSQPAVAAAWAELRHVTGLPEERMVPVTYVNSSAAVKSFVGEHGGAACTSSNAKRVLEWALNQGELVFFFPDQHLGRNAASFLGLPDEQVALWRRGEPLGGCTQEELRRAKVVLWDGYCEVHLRIFPDHVRQWRMRDTQAVIMVHPECRHEVVELVDLSGSTEQIIAAVEGSEPGSRWVIGTELNLVERLARQHPDKSIQPLAPNCACPTMSMISPVSLLEVLDNLAEGRVINQIKVPETTAAQAKKCLDRMLAI